MCKKKQFKYCPSRIDTCMINIIEHLRRSGLNTVACCCGHRKYHMTVVIKCSFLNNFCYRDFVSGVIIPRKKKFYKLNKRNGYYFIPEVEKYWRNKNGICKKI